jgi:hypothetical protein
MTATAEVAPHAVGLRRSAIVEFLVEITRFHWLSIVS